MKYTYTTFNTHQQYKNGNSSTNLKLNCSKCTLTLTESLSFSASLKFFVYDEHSVSHLEKKRNCFNQGN